MIVKIDKLSHDFRGITKIDNKVTFISDTLPDEIVDIRIVSSKKNINEGKVISYIEESNDRIIPKCPYYGECGGCDIAFIKYDKALEYKKNIVIDIMKRYAGIDVNPDIVYDNNIYGYRNKISLKINNGCLALVKEGSNELVNINRCLLVNDNISKVMELFDSIDLTGVKDIVIKGTDEIMVTLNGNIDSELLICLLKDYVSAIILNDKVIYGNDYINIRVDKYNYVVYPKSFFQINTGMIEKLYDKVLEYAGNGKKLLDLYCGAGTIGIYLASNFEYVHGIEVNSDAIESANLNKKINNISNIDFECKKASELSSTNYDVIVVDPPRSGLDSVTISKLLDSGSDKIVYVSCNPITLARDVKLLSDKYEVCDMMLFDMFPNTKHVESVIKLQRKK